MDKREPSPPVAGSEQGATVTQFPRRVVELLQSRASADTVALLQGLLRQAIAGELAGLVVIGLFPPGSDKRYDFSLSGLAAANPTLAVGAVDVCQMLLREAALKEAGLG